MNSRMRWLAVLAIGVLFGVTSSVEASHWRFGHMTWQKVAGTASTVEITVQEGYRQTFIGFNTYSFTGGVASFSTSGATQIASGTDLAGEDWVIMETVVQRVLPNNGPFTVSFSSCCRIGSLINSGSQAMEMVIDLNGGDTGSPISSVTPILQMSRDAVNVFALPIVDPDGAGDPFTVRMATSAESGIPTVATVPIFGGNSLAVDGAGVLTWTTTGALLGQKYAVQVVIESDNGPVQVPLDFIIEIIEGNPPDCNLNGPQNNVAPVGLPFSISATGTDPDGGDLTVSNLGLPAGATMTPASGPVPLVATFNWTPTLADAGGVFVITFVFTDPGGLQHTCGFTVTVPLNQPPDCTNAGPSIAEIWPPNHKMVDIDIVGVTDPDGDPITITITGITQDEPLNDVGDGNFEPDGAGVGTSTASVRAERLGGKGKGGGKKASGGPGNGRVYEISYVAEDDSGASCAGTVTVCVPHDQSGSPCVDDGQNYNSLGAAAKLLVGGELGPQQDLANRVFDGARQGWMDLNGFGERVFALQQNYPNPFNPSTTIQYSLAEAVQVRLAIYSAQGQLVRTLYSGGQGAGSHSVRWDARDNSGREVTSGIYIYRLEAGLNVTSRKMILLK